MKAILCMSRGLLVLVTLGCGSGSSFPDPTPVTGTVTYQGTPVERAKVTFLSQTGGRSASGTTDASGKYSLTTFSPNDGAIPDEYTITIAKYDAADTGKDVDTEETDLGTDYDAMMKAAASGNKKASKLPAKYADATESGLARSVAKGQPNEFNFELE